MDKDKLLQQYLDGDLSPTEEKEALHVIADDDELRSMLRFEQKLTETVSREPLSYETEAVPPGFSDRVMYQIARQVEETAHEGLLEKLKLWYRELWVPQQVQWRPAYSFVLALLVIVSLSFPIYLVQTESAPPQQAANVGGMESSVQQVSAEAGEVMLRFVYIDENASSVAVAGDFSDREPIELSRQTINGEQVWTGLVSMSRGEHNYMFVKDGKQWVTDPLAPVQREDGFGNKNAVIYL